MTISETERVRGAINGNGAGDPSSLPPGAERFWGEFARARAGRSKRTTGGAGGRGEHSSSQECLEWCPVCRSADLIRTTAPADMKTQLEAIQHEAFNVMRAFLNAYSDKTSGVWQGSRSETEPSGPDEPEPTATDIPIR